MAGAFQGSAFQNSAFSTDAAVINVGGAKGKPRRSRRRNYEVEIDGEVFQVRDEQGALDLLLQARNIAKEAATKAATAAVAEAPLDEVPAPVVPKIIAPPELVERIGPEWAQTVDAFDAYYRTMFFLVVQHEQQRRIDDEEAALILLLH